MEQFWRQIRIQRAKIHKTSLVRSPAQGTFFLWACVISSKYKKIQRNKNQINHLGFIVQNLSTSI